MIPILKSHFHSFFESIIGVVLGAPGEDKMEPKLEPKRTQIEDETRHFSDRLSNDLGAILGHSDF